MPHRLAAPLSPGLALVAWLAALSCADTAPATADVAAADAAARPSIVLIMADDMGYSDVGCYGAEIETPNLDALADNGLRFTDFYNAGRCCPTRASLMTGLYAHQADIGHMMYDDGIDGYRGELSDRAVTIAEVLGDAGYRTGMTGKWHLTRQLGLWYGVRSLRSTHNWPMQRGFDSFYGTIHAAGSFFDPVTLVDGNDPVILEDESYYYTDAIADRAVGFIRDDDDRPFFLYVPFTAPHWPLHALPDDIARYRGRYDEGWDVVREDRIEKMRELGLIDERWTPGAARCSRRPVGRGAVPPSGRRGAWRSTRRRSARWTARSAASSTRSNRPDVSTTRW